MQQIKILKPNLNGKLGSTMTEKFLKNKRFIISNQTPKDELKEISSFLKAHGAKVTTRVTKKIDFLVRT